VNCSPALKWFIVLLLPLTLAWKATVGPDDANDLELEVVTFLRNQRFDVTSTSEARKGSPERTAYDAQGMNYMPIIHATSGSCRMLVAKIFWDGSSKYLVGDLAAVNDRVFIVFRGRVYAQQPILLTVFYYLWSRFLRELKLVRHITPVLAVVATPSCTAEQLPWDALQGAF
jgi:hypothetical protein